MVNRHAAPGRVLAGLFLAVGPGLGCEEVPRTYSTLASKGEEIFRDDFERARLGPQYSPTGEGASIESGALKTQNLRNHPLWLNLDLPDAVRIEFDAWARSEEGDIKVELCGDGKSFATSTNYTATGYVVIFGGWNNTLNAVVRKNEHGQERATATDPKVEADRKYHLTITRAEGEVTWEIDGAEALVYDDPQPLRGAGHNRFAFSGWEAEVHFDNLVIEKL